MIRSKPLLTAFRLVGCFAFLRLVLTCAALRCVALLYEGVPQQDCFGLLGANGAGKSTTMSILSGDQKPTSGNAFLSGKNVLTDRENLVESLGFCPQGDALTPDMTGKLGVFILHRSSPPSSPSLLCSFSPLIVGREHLWMYAMIKGVPAAEIGMDFSCLVLCVRNLLLT